MEEERLINRIIARFGKEVQVRKIKEECLELALAITHLDIPTKDKDQTIENIYEELADVQIMMDQANILFDKAKIERIKVEKLEKAANSDWLNESSDSKRGQICKLTGLSACVLKVCECEPKV